MVWEHLYLTTILYVCSHLCFERHSRSLRDPDRFTLSLMDVVRVVKAKPFAVLPGSGMSVEVTLKTGVKVGVACGWGNTGWGHAVYYTLSLSLCSTCFLPF